MNRKTKIKKRFGLVLGFSMGVVLAPVFGMLIAYGVIREGSVALYGAFAVTQAVVQIALRVVSWGNKDFLLRQFSLKPGEIGPLWRSYLITRLVMVLPAVLLAGLLSGFRSEHLPALIPWLCAWFLHQSFEVLAHYGKRFRLWALIESAGSLFILGALWFARHDLDLTGLIRIYTLAAILKCLISAICFRRVLAGWNGWRTDFNLLATALPFLMLSLTHVLQVKTDIFCIDAMLGREQTGIYQIFLSFLVYIKTGAYYVTAPFQKNIYRLRKAGRERYRRLLFAGAWVLIPLGLVFVYVLMTHVYRISPPPSLYLLGGIFALPFYLFLPHINEAIRAGHYGRVFTFDLLSVALNLALNLVLIPRFHLVGALAANACGQWSTWLAYALYHRKAGDRNGGGRP